MNRERVLRAPWLSLYGALLGALFGLPALAIGPAGDDWGYARPRFEFPREEMAPNGLFWRPLDHMVYWITGFAPAWSVTICHFAAVSGHAASLALLTFLLLELGVSRTSTLLATALVAIHPAVTAAVWSVDSNHQTWSTAFGLLSCVALLHGLRVRWLVFAWVAVLWKESGIAWFVAAPFLVLARDFACDRGPVGPGPLIRRLSPGALGAVAYLAVRIVLSGQARLGGSDGRYAFSPHPTVWLTNASMLLGVASLPFDTVVILGRNRRLLAGVLPALAALPLGLLFVRRLFSVLRRRRWMGVAGALALTAVMAPHVLIGHVSEMYAHPLVFALAAVLGCWAASAYEKASSPAASLATCIVLGSAFLSVDIHKFREMLATSQAATSWVLKHSAALSQYRDRGVCFVQAEVGESPGGYSVFQMDVATAAGGGKALVLDWGWLQFDRIWIATDHDGCPRGVAEMRLLRDGRLLSSSEPAP